MAIGRRVRLMIPRTSVRRCLALEPLLQVYLGVPLLLVAPREFPAALVAAERLLAGVRAHVGRQMIAARERSHANATLEGLLPRVNSYVPRELVAPGESAIAAVHRAGIGPLVHGRLARAIWILSRLHRHQPQRQRALLIDLRQDLVALGGAGIVLGQLNARRRRAAALLLLLGLLLRLLLLLNNGRLLLLLLHRRGI